MPEPEDSDRRLGRRLRRRAQRKGLALVKSRVRYTPAFEYGSDMIVDPSTNGVVAGGHPWAYSMNLHHVAEFFSDD